jgi:hypothetical protein
MHVTTEDYPRKEPQAISEAESHSSMFSWPFISPGYSLSECPTISLRYGQILKPDHPASLGGHSFRHICLNQPSRARFWLYALRRPKPSLRRANTQRSLYNPAAIVS